MQPHHIALGIFALILIYALWNFTSKGHKVWVPSKGPKLKGRYERCYNFSN